jgi:hypothetical protein
MRFSRARGIRHPAVVVAALVTLTALAAGASSPGQAPPAPCAPGTVPPATIVARDGYGATLTASHEIGLSVTAPGADEVVVTLPDAVTRLDVDDLPKTAAAHFTYGEDERTFGFIAESAQTVPVAVTWTRYVDNSRDSEMCTATASAGFPIAAAVPPAVSNAKRSGRPPTKIAWSLSYKPVTGNLGPLTVELRADLGKLPRKGSKIELGLREMDNPTSSDATGQGSMVLETKRTAAGRYALKLISSQAFKKGRVHVEVTVRQGGAVLWRMRTTGGCLGGYPCSLRAPKVTRPR